MGVDYTIKIHRKKDDKVIGEFFANYLKTILDGSHSDIIHCDGRNCDKAKFTYDDLCNLQNVLREEVKGVISKIVEKKFMIPMCSNSDIKFEIERDISELEGEDGLESTMNQIGSCSLIEGMIHCMVEDLIVDGEPGYKRNAAKDDKNEYNSIWVEDIYCEVEANW